MNPYNAIVDALNRIATATSIIRTRAEDASRLNRHGGMNGDLLSRAQATAVELEQLAADTEKALA